LKEILISLDDERERNIDNSVARLPFIFNSIIESLDLRELALPGRQFTWANRRENPMFEETGRILASVD
jgi:hypothetical protein